MFPSSLPLFPDRFTRVFFFFFFLKSKVFLAKKWRIICRWGKETVRFHKPRHSIRTRPSGSEEFGIRESHRSVIFQEKACKFSRRPLRKWMTGWTTSIYGKRWAGCSGSISKENDFMGRKGVVVVGKMRVEFSVPDVLSNEPWRIFTSDQLAKWKGRSRKCSRSAGPVPYFLIWRSVFAHSEQENSTTPYHPRAYRVWKRAESEARSLENCRLKI